MGGKRREGKKLKKSAILFFSSNTDTQMQNNSEPLPAHTMALDTCGSLVSPHRRATNTWGTKNNNQHKQTRENKRTRTHPHTQAHGRELARGGGQAQQWHLWHRSGSHLYLVCQGAMIPHPRPRNRIHSLWHHTHTHTHTHAHTKGERGKKTRRQQSTIRCYWLYHDSNIITTTGNKCITKKLPSHPFKASKIQHTTTKTPWFRTWKN